MPTDDQLQECLSYYRDTVLPALDAAADGEIPEEMDGDVSLFEAYLPIGDDVAPMNRRASRFVTCLHHYTDDHYRNDCASPAHESVDALLRDVAAEIEAMLATVAGGDTPDYDELDSTLTTLQESFTLRDDVDVSRVSEDSPAGAALAAYVLDQTPTGDGERDSDDV